MSSVNKKKRTSSKNTTLAQYLAMVVFLEENKESKELISGEVHGKAVVAGSKLRKKDGFKEMVELVMIFIGILIFLLKRLCKRAKAIKKKKIPGVPSCRLYGDLLEICWRSAGDPHVFF